jgi:hypothetical protein
MTAIMTLLSVEEKDKPQVYAAFDEKENIGYSG